MPEYAERSQPPRIISAARIMLHALTISCALVFATAAPVTYDQRQDGDFNVRADLQNVVFLIVPPTKIPISSDILDLFTKDAKQDQAIQDRADHVMDAFVEPNTPYRVEIGSDRSAEGDGRAVEVVIAGRRQNSVEDGDEWKLLGAMEQCGPDRVRDSVTLTCRDKEQPEDVEPPQKDSDVKEPVTKPEASV